jgi:hypothetical protein
VLGIGTNNSEYMEVLGEVVSCLVHQLEHPQLTALTESDLTEWFHRISIEQVREILARRNKAAQMAARGDVAA